jgi:4-amino-4-deoxy-L-arabinose transferase-like glycosyltransferase
MEARPAPMPAKPQGRQAAGKVGSDRVGLLFLVLCLAGFSIKSWDSLVAESATWDETHYYGVGQRLLEHGRWDFRDSILHPPLAFYLSALPMLTSSLDPSLWPTDSAHRGMADTERGRRLLASPSNHDDRLLNRARGVMVCVGMLLGVFVFLWAREVYGPWGASLAILLYSFCPNILAHARLITPDIVLTAFSFAALYSLHRMLITGQRIHAIVCGLAWGLALLSKYTALLFLPMAGLLVLAWSWRRRSFPLTNVLIVTGLGLFVLVLGYRFDLEPYLSGIAYQRAHARLGQMAFLAGKYSDTGFWNYQFVAFLLKTPVAVLTFLCLALVVYPWRRSFEERMRAAFLLLPAVTLFLFFAFNPQSIGLRYVLPLYPFLFVFIASVIRFAERRRWRAVLLFLLAGWQVLASTSIHPHYLAYFNEFIAGPDHGQEYLVDSNLDWGQGLKGLAQYMRERGISRVSLSYFGSDDPQRHGIAYDWLPSVELRNPNPGKQLANRFLAISATNLQGVYFPDKELFAALRKKRPIAKIGYSIFIYDMRAGEEARSP